jgi:hypothetical protein
MRADVNSKKASLFSAGETWRKNFTRSPHPAVRWKAGVLTRAMVQRALRPDHFLDSKFAVSCKQHEAFTTLQNSYLDFFK